MTMYWIGDDKVIETGLRKGTRPNFTNCMDFVAAIAMYKEECQERKVPRTKSGMARACGFSSLSHFRRFIEAGELQTEGQRLAIGKGTEVYREIVEREMGEIIEEIEIMTLSMGNVSGPLHWLKSQCRDEFGDKQDITLNAKHSIADLASLVQVDGGASIFCNPSE